MSGHSKWSQIKHRKAITDGKKAQLFGKLAKAIIAIARENPDPKMNLKLQSAIDNARAQDMPNDNIDRLLKRASEKADAALEEMVLEAYGPGNVGILISILTDSRNRTLNDIKTLLMKNGGRMASEGSVAWIFKKTLQDGAIDFVPSFTVPITDPETKAGLDKLYELLDDHDDVQNIYSNEA